MIKARKNPPPTAKCVSLPCDSSAKVDLSADVRQLMRQVANALDMKMSDYKGGRKRANADLRCIACYIIKQRYPEIQLITTADAMGIDHTAVVYHLNRARNYLETNEKTFARKLETLIKTLDYDKN